MIVEGLSGVRTTQELVGAVEALRCRAARGTGQVRVSLEKLATATGIPRSTLHAYIRGQRLPPPDALDRIVTALGASPAEQAAWAEALERMASTTVDQGTAPTAAEPVPRQLPPSPARVVGREQDAQRLFELVTHRRGDGPAVVVLCGSGGIGKTTLALRWAHQHAARFPDGQLWVDLRGYGPAAPLAVADALERLVRAVGLGTAELPADVDARAAVYRSALSGRRMLVVLDNARDSAQVQPLLPGNPDVVTLITSRDALRALVAGHGADRMVVEPLDRAAAHDLVTSGLPEPVAAAVTEQEVVEHCDGLPLALCIVRDRLSSATLADVREFAAELGGGRGERLTALDLNDDSLDTSVRGALTWSYRTLPPDAARLLRLLPLCQVTTFDAMSAAVLFGADRRTATRLLDRLVAANMLDRIGIDRFRVHDLVIAFAAERLAAEEAPDAVTAARHRLLAHLIAITEAAIRRADPLRGFRLARSRTERFEGGAVPDLTEWFTRYADMVAAVAVDAVDAVVLGATDAPWVLLERGWHALYHVANTGMLSQAMSVALDAALATGRALEAGVMARLLGVMHGHSGELDLAQQLFTRAVDITESAGLTETSALDRANIALVAMIRGELSRARQAFTEGLRVLTGRERISTVASLIVLELQHGDVAAAERLLPEAAELTTLADTMKALDIALAVARYHLARGAGDLAAAQLADIVRTATAANNKIALSEALELQAAVYRDAGQLDDAERTAQEALRTARRQGCRRDEIAALDVLADVLTQRGRGEEGLVLLEQALTLSRESSLRYGECCTVLQLARTHVELGAHSAARAAASVAAELAATHEYRELARACAALGVLDSRS